MMFWNHDRWGFGDWLAMSMFMVVFWGLIIAWVVWRSRGPGNDGAGASGVGSSATLGADENLAKRFARGEIDEDELTRQRGLLKAAGGSSHSAGGA